MTRDELQERRDIRNANLTEGSPKTTEFLFTYLIEAIDDHAATMEESVKRIDVSIMALCEEE